jgi:hypothetical protein
VSRPQADVAGRAKETVENSVYLRRRNRSRPTIVSGTHSLAERVSHLIIFAPPSKGSAIGERRQGPVACFHVFLRMDRLNADLIGAGFQVRS